MAKGQQQKSGAKANSPAAKSAQRKAQSANAAASVYNESGFVDARTKRDICGVVFVVLGVALFAMMMIPSKALVTSVLSEILRLAFGMGAYILPFVLVLIGFSFIIRFQRQRMPTRVAVGLFLVFLAVLGILGVLTPGADISTIDKLFLKQNLLAQGGYVGAGIAWVGLMYLGLPVSIIVLSGVIIVAFMIIGFTVNRLIDRVHAIRDRKKLQQANASQAAVEQPVYSTGAPQRKGLFGRRNKQLPPGQPAPTIGGFDDMPKSSRNTVRLGGSSQSATSTAGTRRLGGRPVTRKPSTVIDAEVVDISQSPTRRFDDGEPPAALTRKLGEEKPAPKRKKPAKKVSPSAATLAFPQATEGFVLPSMSLLKKTSAREKKRESDEILQETAELLQQTLEDFGVPVEVVGWVAGPTVTLFKIDLPSGIRVNKVTNLTDDIALALAAPGVRIFAPIPGTNYVGVEVPNRVRQNVFLGDILPAAKTGPLQVAIGEDVEGHKMVFDLAKMPHLLVGGTTGSGKSIAINSMIMSILMRATPDEVRFIMIDPKRVEFAPYNGIPHLYVPVVTEPREAASALSWGVAEMERRLKVFSKVGARDIGQYNTKVHQGALDEEGAEPAKQMPYIVIVIDELADLMMNVGKDVEFSISRIAQLARAAGIHMIVATQRPSTNVVTGLIKANITNRMALTVASGIDSRVILDTTGAENLIGNGDMLFGKPEFPKPVRLQGCFVSPEEIEAVVEHLKEQGEPDYHTDILKTNLMSMGTPVSGSNGSASNEDPLLWEAAELVVGAKFGSTSNIQRHFSIGYSRAGRIMDMLEEKGVVGPANGSKPREVLVDELELESIKAFEAND
ncbi:MAG: DNA translocase FtsK [Coriobacteriia bacterium]|nr:DNA translocase FtsK [Coriobacteriia bacterium]